MTPLEQVRRWKKELQLATKREKDWRDAGEKIVKRYRGEDKKKNRYNVLWATTETLRPAIYNSKPSPDVRRRFRDADPVGKAVGETLERSLFVLFDGDEPDQAIKNDLLDALLAGRGVSRIRYVPKLAERGETRPATAKKPDEDAAASEPPEDAEEDLEEVEDEQVVLEHVDWRDYREGYGRTWEEVPWVAFRHKLIRQDAEEKFGKEKLKGVKFTQPQQDDPAHRLEQVGETQKIAEFWEVWDKEEEKVFFLQEEVQELLYPIDDEDGEPPLDFEGFFPCPQPLELIENTGSRLPIAPFTLYENQANELDKISTRIDRIVSICRLRGIYDSKLAEIPDLLAGDDNELTPVQNAQAWADKGLDAAISWMPVDKVQAVLEALYDARERQKQIIDELTGVSDIVRGVTDPNETASAQTLKANYHSIRLSRMQHVVQRYVRDLMRLAAQVMSSKFASQTFAEMTDLKFPTQEQKVLLQARAQQAMGMQQPIDPNMQVALQAPTWEEILALMHSPALRQFRVDVETDSTIAAALDSDMASLSMLLKAVGETMTEMAPLVVSQALPIDAAKEIVMAVIRRARLGTAVEDAFDKMQAPKPQTDPNAGRLQEVQAKAQADVQVAQIKADLDARVAQAEQAAQARQNAQEQALEAQREEMKAAREEMQVRLDAAVKIIVATIQASKAAAEVPAQQEAGATYAQQ